MYRLKASCGFSVPSAAFASSVVLMGLVAAPQGRAAEWEQDLGVSANVYATDNFCLSRDLEESEVVATVAPRARVVGQGSRAEMALDARVEFNTLDQTSVECPLGGQAAGRGNRESVIPSGRFFAAAEAVENLFFLEANAAAALNPINPFGAGLDDAINGRQNTNIARSWGVGARLEREFEQQVRAMLRYNYNEQVNSANQVYGDNTQDRVDFNIGMLPGSSRVFFGASGRYRATTFEGTAASPPFTSTLSSVEGTMGITLSPEWQLNALAGEEFNDFLSINEEIDGVFWDVGIRWTPNSRVSVNVGTGERFFGDTPRADISYRHRRSQFSLSYSKSLVNPRNLRNAQASSVDDVIPPPPGGIPGDPIPGDDNPVIIGDSPIINEAFAANYSFSARRTVFNLNLRESKQTRTVDLSEAQFRNAGVSVSRTISSGLSVAARVGWRESQSEGGFITGFGRDVEVWTGALSLTRKVARRTSVSVAYRYLDQQSTLATNTFVENRLTLSINHSFR